MFFRYYFPLHVFRTRKHMFKGTAQKLKKKETHLRRRVADKEREAEPISFHTPDSL